jgi:glycosyltransferase involved in cell wall biosynthesis
LEAIKKLSENYNNIKLLLIGPVDSAEKDDFDEAVERLDLREGLIYFPWKDISQLPSYISISDVCVSPLVKNDQHESGVANKIFQYMYFKRPLVVSNCKPQADIVTENKCGVVFESENVNQLADKISLFLKNPALINEFGENGYKAILESYNTKMEGENLASLYKGLSN